MALTDFSSAISDVAYLDRPVIYFQFDEDEIFSGNHVCKQGYFSFRRDGFGPVEVHADAVMERLDEALSGREDPQYSARRRQAFVFRDGQCCERVTQAIEKIARRAPPPTATPDTIGGRHEAQRGTLLRWDPARLLAPRAIPDAPGEAVEVSLTERQMVVASADRS